jgi:hypothetical protein
VNIEVDTSDRVSLYLLLSGSCERGAMQDPRLPSHQRSTLLANSHPLPDTKERPFKCGKCKSTFVRRDLLLRHDRTVHAKDGDRLQPETRKSGPKTSSSTTTPSKPSISIEPGTFGTDRVVVCEAAAMLMTAFQHKAAAAANGVSTTAKVPSPNILPTVAPSSGPRTT